METSQTSSVETFLARARSALGRGIRYRLGAGGMDARAESPADANNECDCSGFVCWALGISRQTDHPMYVRFNGGWINTDAMVHDAQTASGFFTRVTEARVGSIVVYGARPAAQNVGHVGIVTAIGNDGGVTRAMTVLHCSHGNHQQHGDAVCQTGISVFARRDATFAWWIGLR